MGNWFKLFFLMLMITVNASVFAAVIRDISIEGDLNRTSDDTILGIIRFNKGDEISSSDKDTIRQRLIRSGLFVNESIRVDLGIQGEEAYLSLFLKDRFSLIPIPILMAGDGGVKGGLYLIDMNVGGTGNRFFAGGLFGRSFRYASFNYTSMDLSGSPWSLGGGFDYFSDRVGITSIDGDEELYSYELDVIRAYFMAKRKADPWGMRLKIYGITSEYENFNGRVNTVNPKITFSYDDTVFRDYFIEGFNVSVKYGLLVSNNHFESGHTLNADLRGAWLPFESLSLDLNANCEIFRGNKHQSTPLSSLILPWSVRAEDYYSIRPEVQAVLADLNWVYLVLPFSYELGYVDGISAVEEFYHGPVAGLTVNLKQVAIPALSLYYGWNIEERGGVLHFSLGYTY